MKLTPIPSAAAVKPITPIPSAARVAEVVPVDNAHIIITDVPIYSGVSEITPSDQIQILDTADKRLNENIVINPIPKNYGLVTYNGFSLKIT